MIPITPSDLDLCPKLECIFSMSTGVEWVEKQKDEFTRRGVTVINAPQTNVATVSEHAFALYFASRRKVVEMHVRTVGTDEYADKSTLRHHFPEPPRTCSRETLVIFGNGHLGKRVAEIGRALQMKVLVAERKGATTTPREGRVSFDACLRQGTVFIVTVPKNDETLNMISGPELAMMRRDAIVINIARGGIVNEVALASALKDNQIGAAAVDVFDTEPPRRGTSALLDPLIPNLILSPHIAWFSIETIRNLQDAVLRGLSSYVAGNPINVVV
ncbi:hypothetical protein ACJ41O_008977 [Fusarium nematophilum]